MGLSNKVALIGDLHFGVKNFNLDFLQEQMFSLKKYCDILKEKNVDTIIQLGDVFDNRKIMDNNFLYVLKKEFKNIFKDFKMHCIVGNHDMYFRDTRDVNSPMIYMYDMFDMIFVNHCNIKINSINFSIYPYFTEKEFEQNNSNNVKNKEVEVILGHFEFKDFNFAYNTINNHSNYSINDFIGNEKNILLFSGHYHFSNNEHYIGTPYQMDFKEFGLAPKIVVLEKNENLEIKVEEIENTWSKRHYKAEIYSDKVLLEYDYRLGKEDFKGNLPKFCKIGNIYVKENNEKLEKILEYFSVNSDSISVYRENVINELKTMSKNSYENEGVSSSDLYIKEYIRENKPDLLPLLEKIWS